MRIMPSISGMRTRRATIALCVVLLFLATFLTVSFHYHPDGKEQSNCPICEVKYNQSTVATYSVPILDVPSNYSLTEFPSISYQAPPTPCISAFHSRAPPTV